MTSTLLTCDICSKPGVPTNTILFKTDNDIWLLAHLACYDQYIGKCASCVNAQACTLDADHTLPKYVMKIVRQGSMTLQTQVLNPQLVDKHCHNGCLCYDGNNCLHQNGQGCQNYKLIVSTHQ